MDDGLLNKPNDPNQANDPNDQNKIDEALGQLPDNLEKPIVPPTEPQTQTPPPPPIPPLPPVSNTEVQPEQPETVKPTNKFKTGMRKNGKQMVGGLMAAVLLLGGLLLGNQLIKQRQIVEKEASACGGLDKTACAAVKPFCTLNRLYECQMIGGECKKVDIGKCGDDGGEDLGNECVDSCSHNWCKDKRIGYTSPCGVWVANNPPFKFTCTEGQPNCCAVLQANIDYASCEDEGGGGDDDGDVWCSNDTSNVTCGDGSSGMCTPPACVNAKDGSYVWYMNTCIKCKANLGCRGDDGRPCCSSIIEGVSASNCEGVPKSPIPGSVCQGRTAADCNGCAEQFYECKWMDGECKKTYNRACGGLGEVWYCNTRNSAASCLGKDAGSSCNDGGTCTAEGLNCTGPNADMWATETGAYCSCPGGWSPDCFPKCSCEGGAATQSPSPKPSPQPSPSKSPNPSQSPQPSPSPSAVPMACVNLGGGSDGLKVGDTETFVCTGANFSAAAPAAFFRYSVDGGTYTTSQAVLVANDQASYDVDIDQAGEWVVQCRICTDSSGTDCTVWGQAY